MKPGHEQWLKRWSALFEIPALDPERLLRRIEVMERNITLPVKAVSAGVDAVTTSQSEADQRRGREIREQEEREGREARRREREERRQQERDAENRSDEPNF